MFIANLSFIQLPLGNNESSLDEERKLYSSTADIWRKTKTFRWSLLLTLDEQQKVFTDFSCKYLTNNNNLRCHFSKLKSLYHSLLQTSLFNQLIPLS